MRYAQVKNGKVRRVVSSDAMPPNGTWVECDASVNVSWAYDGATFTAPPPPPTYYRKLLTGPEWVETWTTAEWRAMKNARGGTGAVAEKLDQFLDAIQITNSLNLEASIAVRFYDWLEANGYIDSARKAELTQGIQQ